MPNRKLTKEENQPSIKTLLPNRTEGVECINVDQESANSTIDINNINSSSTQKLCTDKDYWSPAPTADQTLNDTELTGFKEVKLVKKRKRKSRSSGSPQNQPTKKVNISEVNNMDGQGPSPNHPIPPNTLETNSEVSLSPKLLELERRINQTMIANITNGIKTALKPIQESIDNIQKSSDLILQQESRIKQLTVENEQLLSEVKQVRCELKEFKERLLGLENKSLECNLIFRGVEEPLNETSESLKERLYWILADTIDNPNPAERLSAAKGCSIHYCRRLGKPNPTRPRPISVEFDRRVDADIVYDSRFYLTKAVFIDREFNLETEKCRRTLRPILCAAKQKSEYRYKSRLEGAKLVIDCKRYGVNDLDRLPDSLQPFEVSTKANEEMLGFFGELCPFSNFYPINFTFNGATYHSSEQFIQHQKALYCND